MLKFARRFFGADSPSLRVLDSVSAYALWAAQYPAQAHNTLMQVEEAAMQTLFPDFTEKIVLDLACGTGRYGQMAQAAGAQQCIGIDNSAAMLRQGELTDITLASMQAIPLPENMVDVILCGMAIGHLPDVAKSLSEMARVLKPGGICLLSDFHPFQAFAGAQRTFQSADGQHFAVEHYPHTYSDYHRAAQQNHLQIIDVHEAYIPGHQTPAGYEAPVVLILKLQKSG